LHEVVDMGILDLETETGAVFNCISWGTDESKQYVGRKEKKGNLRRATQRGKRPGGQSLCW
jgi:hypothetical protein